MENPIDYVAALIASSEQKCTRLRRWGMSVIATACTLSIYVLWRVLEVSSTAGSDSLPTGLVVMGTVALVIFGYFSKTLLALSNAYALRCGQLEDMKILLLTHTGGTISANDLVSALVAFRRGVLEEMVKATIPDGMPAKLAASLFGASTGKSEGESGN